jgi:hypothetical protein
MYGCVSLANNRWQKQSCIKGRPDSLAKIPLNGKYFFLEGFILVGLHQPFNPCNICTFSRLISIKICWF